MSTTISNLLPKITSLQSEYTQVISSLATATAHHDLVSNSRLAASITANIVYLSNEQVLQTATASNIISSASTAASNASLLLSSLYQDQNVYGMMPSYGGNMAMAIVMGIFFLFHTILGIFYKQWWFFVSYFCGTGLEMAGYIGRTLASHDVIESNYFLLQIIALTIAPVFIMAGIYYLLAQLIIIYGERFSTLKPMYYSYIFITCDFISLVIQAAGGGMAGSASANDENPDNGTHVMVAGLAFQVLTMSVFIILFVDFLRKIKYGTKKHYELEPLFNPVYSALRSRWIFKVFPIAISFGVIFVYVRCIYRVIELAEGWRGYLITHEIYFMILDALMMGLTCILFIFFHPGVIYRGHEVTALRKSKKEVVEVELLNDTDLEKTSEANS